MAKRKKKIRGESAKRSQRVVDRIEYEEARYRLEQFFRLLLQMDKARLNALLGKGDDMPGWSRPHTSGQSILDKIYGKNLKFKNIAKASKQS